MENEAPGSQESSHFILDPIPGSVLLDREIARRDGLKQMGNILTGCKELDDSTLLGGFERGCIVGISAEDEEIGLLIGLQSIARLLASAEGQDSSTEPRAVIVTTLSASALLPTLRDVIKGQLESVQKETPDPNSRIRPVLERVSISRIFDFEGLWEVLGELDPHPETESTPEAGEETFTGQIQAPGSSPEPPPHDDRNDKVIQDSEEEDELSAPQSGTNSPEAAVPPHVSPKPSDLIHTSSTTTRARKRPMPDIILITHMSSLMTALFTRRDKATAHTTLQLLSSHLRFLTHSPAHEAPLVMVLNSTSPPPSATDRKPPTTTRANPDAAPTDHDRLRPRPKPLDPTLRSVFTGPALPAPPSFGYGHGYGYGYGGGGGGGVGTGSASRSNNNSNKPSFGLVFAQLLDIHILCSRVPRTRADAEAEAEARAMAVSGETEGGGGGGAGGPRGRFAWVVEVLLDEIGVWEGTGAGRPRRRSREQRWGAVDVVGGVRVVDAFPGGVGEIQRTASGQ